MIKEINVIAPVTTQTSYGLCSLYLTHAMSDENVKVNLLPIGQSELHPYFSKTREFLDNGRYFNRGPTLRIFHQFSQDLFCGEPHIGFPIFELDGFNDLEKHHLKQLDMVLVTSEWAKKIVKPLNDRVEVVNLGVDTNLFKIGKSNHKKRFLHVGKVEIRKHSKEIVDLFSEEFKNDDVELWLAWDNLFIGKEQEEWNLYAKKKLGNKVTILNRFQDFREVAVLMAQCDYFISLSSGEGWNMPLLEAMACGMPCIATNCTGQTEFVTKDNCFLIQPTRMDFAYDGLFFKDKIAKWHRIDYDCKEQFKRGLRKMMSMERNKNGIETARKFSWKNSAKQIIAAIQSMN